jgi:hypothetical protein
MARNSGKFGSAVLVAVIICFGFFLLGVVGLMVNGLEAGYSSINRGPNEISNYRFHDPQTKALADAATEQFIRNWTEIGFIHSVHIQENYARLDPVLWSQLPIEIKQGAVRAFSHYFASRGQSGRVEIRSSRNDRKLASYSVWTGVKILE